MSRRGLQCLVATTAATRLLAASLLLPLLSLRLRHPGVGFLPGYRLNALRVAVGHQEAAQLDFGLRRRRECLDVQHLLRQLDDQLAERERIVDDAVLVPAPLAVARPGVVLAGVIARQR